MDKKLIQIRVSPEDWARMEALAKSQGFAGVATWARVALIKVVREPQVAA